MSYTIKTVGPSKEITTKYGPLKVYSVQFEGAEDWVEINQKPESPAPTAGDNLDGTIESTQYGKRFKKAQVAGGFTGGRQTDPETRGSIERQTALKEAREAVYNFQVLADGKPSDLDAYIVEIIATAKKFQAYLGNANAQTTVKAEDDNLPPITSYEQMQ